MKKTTFAISLSILLIFSCIFASCNSDKPIFGDSADTTSPQIEETMPSSSSSSYLEIIQELEDRIVELQKSQYISDAQKQEELLRLQSMLAALTGKNDVTDTTSDTTDTESDISDETTSEDTEADIATFSYTLDGDQATITGYSGDATRLTLPSMIDGYSVVAIADDAFASSKLTSVIIPDGITKIGWFAFSECSSLTAITIPESVTSIGYSAFPSYLDEFTVYCHSNSFAQKYAQSYGIAYAVI